jgi:hypothetical protein
MLFFSYPHVLCRSPRRQRTSVEMGVGSSSRRASGGQNRPVATFVGPSKSGRERTEPFHIDHAGGGEEILSRQRR